ncbi:DedA family protein, partial [Serratia marcescens]
VRTLLPTMAGISGLNSSRFQVFNWLSAAIWVCALVGLGYAFSQIPLVKRYESQVMTGLMLLPLLLLFVGLLGAMLVIWRKKRAASS